MFSSSLFLPGLANIGIWKLCRYKRCFVVVENFGFGVDIFVEYIQVCLCFWCIWSWI